MGVYPCSYMNEVVFGCNFTMTLRNCIAFIFNLQAESAIAALNCSGVVLGSLPIRLV